MKKTFCTTFVFKRLYLFNPDINFGFSTNLGVFQAERLVIESELPDEPNENSKQSMTKIRFRLPKGEFLERRFLASSKLQVSLLKDAIIIVVCNKNFLFVKCNQLFLIIKTKVVYKDADLFYYQYRYTYSQRLSFQQIFHSIGLPPMERPSRPCQNNN